MGSSQITCCVILVVSLTILTSLSASTSISVLSERRLLQVVERCPVDFEHQNYTIITSKCKAPKYPATQCCSALKEFACPFAAELDDPKNDCAVTMFSYIKHIGKYPNALFSSLCREGNQGLSCRNKEVSKKKKKNKKKNNGNQKIITCYHHQLLLLLLLVLWLV